MKHSTQIKLLSEENRLNDENIEKIFLEKENKKKKESKVFRIDREKVNEFFDKEQTESEIEETIIEALSFYFDHIKREERQEEINTTTMRI